MAKKRHHTVSEFLLQRFATDGKVCQLEVGSGGNRRIPPNDATVEKHFYSIDIDGGQRSPAVEDALGQVESVGAPLIERVMNGEFLESTQRSELALFAAMTWLRTPRWRQETQSVLEQGMEYWFVEKSKSSTVEDLREAIGAMAESMTDDEVTALRDEFLDDLAVGHAGIGMPTNGMIGLFLQSVTAMGWILFCLDWGIVRTKERLILGDTPVSQYDPRPMYPGSAAGLLGSENSEFFLPLDPYCGLVLFPNPATLGQVRDLADKVRDMPNDELLATVGPLEGGRAVREIDASMVANLNLRTYCHASRFVYGHQQAVTDTHRYAKKESALKTAMMPRPKRLHILEDDPTRAGVMRAVKIIEPKTSPRKQRAGRPTNTGPAS